VRHPGGSSAVSAAWTNRATAVVCARLGFHCRVNGTSCPEATGRTTVLVWAAARDGVSRIQSTSGWSAQRVAARSVSTSPAVGGLMPAWSRACFRRGDLLKDHFRPGEELSASAGHRDPAGGAGEQRRAQLAFQAADLLAQRGRAHVQPFGGPAEMKVGSHRHERLKLPQFHKLTVPPKIRTAQERVSARHALLFGRTEESVSELPPDPPRRRVMVPGLGVGRPSPVAARLERCFAADGSASPVALLSAARWCPSSVP
jgi:hypothetical protein